MDHLNHELSSSVSNGTLLDDISKPKQSTRFLNKDEKEAIAKHIENLLVRILAAINARDWDYLLAPPEINGLSPDARIMVPAGMRPAVDSMVKIVETFKALAKDYPKWHLQIVSMDTRVCDLGLSAEVVANSKCTGGRGVPIGMSRNTVTIYDFQKINGVWQGVKDTTIPGIGLDRSVTGLS